MSSNIEVQRICEHCGKEFIARTTKTRYCEKKCNSAAYKKKEREKKIVLSNHDVAKAKEKSKTTNSILIKDKDILTISEAAIFLSVCRKTIYNWLNSGIIIGMRVSQRKVLILKSDLIKKLEENLIYEKAQSVEPKPITEFYTTKEVMEKYGLGQTWLYKLIAREKFPKIQIGGKTHLSKKHIDAYFKKKRDAVSNINEWYTVPEIQENYNLTREQIYGRVSENRIPKKREGRFVKISKQHFDELFIIRR
jgi:excisionase family DNA binding protein